MKVAKYAVFIKNITKNKFFFLECIKLYPWGFYNNFSNKIWLICIFFLKKTLRSQNINFLILFLLGYIRSCDFSCESCLKTF